MPREAKGHIFMVMVEQKCMKKELDYFYIGKAYGGNQDWFLDFMMHIGGCAAVTACDSSIYLARSLDKDSFYPFNAHALTKKDYILFSKIMKPYLSPRAGGIDRLEIYIDGYSDYLRDREISELRMEAFDGNQSLERGWETVKEQIFQGMPIPYLLLRHQDSALKDFVWHWFLLTGFYESEKIKLVKAVSYGEWQWLNFENLWNTGKEPKGGMILYHWEPQAASANREFVNRKLTKS